MWLKKGSEISRLTLLPFLCYSLFPFDAVGSARQGKTDVKCPGLPLESRWGVHVDCMLTSKGVQSFDCTSPVPQDTIALYGCQRYFKQVTSSSPIKLMRCDKSGRWTRMEHFNNLKCEYECGKAHPVTKTLIINDRITTRQIWPSHVLIYYKLDPWEVQLISEAEGAPLESNSESQLIINEIRVPISTTTPTSTSITSGTEEAYTEIPEGETEESSTISNDILEEEEEVEEGTSTTFSPDEPDELNERNDTVNEVNTRLRRSIGGSYYAYICGGSLISPTKVLTAAHCLTTSSGLPKNAKDFTVVLGAISNSFYTNRQDSSSQIIGVQELHISTAFNYEKFEGDIGIISLSSPAKFSNVVFPVCLPENDADSRSFLINGKGGEVIGSKPEIGRTPLGQVGIGLSTQLKSKKLHVLPTIECSRNIDRIPTDREFCAGMKDEVICSGDSGGGMVSSPNYGLRRRYTIQGIVSYARARRLCENYAVFTRVYKFMDWITSVLNSSNTTSH